MNAVVAEIKVACAARNNLVCFTVTSIAADVVHVGRVRVSNQRRTAGRTMASLLHAKARLHTKAHWLLRIPHLLLRVTITHLLLLLLVLHVHLLLVVHILLSLIESHCLLLRCHLLLILHLLHPLLLSHLCGLLSLHLLSGGQLHIILILLLHHLSLEVLVLKSLNLLLLFIQGLISCRLCWVPLAFKAD